MKKISLLLVVLFLGMSVKSQSELTMKPEKVHENEKIVFSYIPSEKYTKGEKLYLSLFTFTYSSTNPAAHELVFRYVKDSVKYVAEFTLPANVIYTIMHVTNGKLIDNNGGNFWDILVLNTEGKPLKGAYLKNSITYLGNLPISADREANFTKAVELLKKEIELYPDNVQADIGLTSLQFDLKLINKTDFDNKMSNLAMARFNPDDENDVRAMSRALKIMNNQDKAGKIEADYAVKFPQSSLAEELYMASLAKAKSRKEFTDGAVEYFNKFPNSANKDRINSALISSFMQSGAYGELLEKMNTIKNIGPGAYIKLAFSMLENDKVFADSGKEYKINEAARLLKIAEKEASNVSLLAKPQYMTDSEWKRRQEIDLAAVQESLGKVYNMKKEYSAAVSSYNTAMDIYADEAPPELYESIIQGYYELAEYDKAYRMTEKSLLNSKSTDEIDKLFPNLYKKLKGDEADYSSAFDSLLLKAKNNRIANLKKNMLNLKVDLGMIETLNGIKIDLNIIKGKVIILEFWSTWCGPCSDVLSSLESIYNMYSDNSNIMIAAVDIWEKGTDRKTDVQNYVEKGEFDLPVYLDIKDNLPKKLSVSGLPTRYYFDKEGVLQFKEIGFSGMDESIRNASDIIELLLQK